MGGLPRRWISRRPRRGWKSLRLLDHDLRLGLARPCLRPRSDRRALAAGRLVEGRGEGLVLPLLAGSRRRRSALRLTKHHHPLTGFGTRVLKEHLPPRTRRWLQQLSVSARGLSREFWIVPAA